MVAETQQLTRRRERVAAAGGEMLGAVFNFLGELVAKDSAQPPAEGLVAQVRDHLGRCIEEDASGRPRLTVTLPDRGALDSLAQTLARLLLAGGENYATRRKAENSNALIEDVQDCSVFLLRARMRVLALLARIR